MKYLRTYIDFNENKNDIIIPNIIQSGDDFYLTVGDTEAYGIYSGDLFSENLPLWAKKEFYLVSVSRQGYGENDIYKGYGKIAIEAMIKKAKQLGADIFTLRVDNGLGFEGENTKLYLFYKNIGFNDINTEESDGGMFIDLRNNVKYLKEDNQYTYKELEFVCHNSNFEDSTNKNTQKIFYTALLDLQKKSNYGIIPYMQDFSDDEHCEISLAVIIVDKINETELEKKIMLLSNKYNVEFDLYNDRNNNFINSVIKGKI